MRGMLRNAAVAMALHVCCGGAAAGGFEYLVKRVMIHDVFAAQASTDAGPKAEAPRLSWQSLDNTSDVFGFAHVMTHDSGAIDSFTYEVGACLPCVRPRADSAVCSRECYIVADAVRAVDYTGDGRLYTVRSLVNGAEYRINVIRRETDPASKDPSFIFSLVSAENTRRVYITVIMKLIGGGLR